VVGGRAHHAHAHAHAQLARELRRHAEPHGGRRYGERRRPDWREKD
jgi:hypothetical protein